MMRLTEFKGDWSEVNDMDGYPIIPDLATQITKKVLPFYALKLVVEVKYRLEWISSDKYTEEKRKLSIDLNYLSSIGSKATDFDEIMECICGRIKSKCGILPWPYHIVGYTTYLWDGLEQGDGEVAKNVLSELDKGPIIAQLIIDDDYAVCPPGDLWKLSAKSSKKYEHIVVIVAKMDVDKSHDLPKGKGLIFKAIDVLYGAGSNVYRLISSKYIECFHVPQFFRFEFPPMELKAAVEEVIKTAAKSGSFIAGKSCVEHLESQIAHRKKRKHNDESSILEGVARLCVLAEGYDQSSVGASVKELCDQLKVNILDGVCSPTSLGRWAGISDESYCILIIEWGVETEGYHVIIANLRDSKVGRS